MGVARSYKAQVGFRGPQRIFAGVHLTKRGLEGYLDLPRCVEMQPSLGNPCRVASFKERS